jgi:hypothetical protein
VYWLLIFHQDIQNLHTHVHTTPHEHMVHGPFHFKFYENKFGGIFMISSDWKSCLHKTYIVFLLKGTIIQSRCPSCPYDGSLPMSDGSSVWEKCDARVGVFYSFLSKEYRSVSSFSNNIDSFIGLASSSCTDVGELHFTVVIGLTLQTLGVHFNQPLVSRRVLLGQ